MECEREDKLDLPRGLQSIRVRRRKPLRLTCGEGKRVFFTHFFL